MRSRQIHVASSVSDSQSVGESVSQRPVSQWPVGNRPVSQLMSHWRAQTLRPQTISRPQIKGKFFIYRWCHFPSIWLALGISKSWQPFRLTTLEPETWHVLLPGQLLSLLSLLPCSLHSCFPSVSYSPSVPYALHFPTFFQFSTIDHICTVFTPSTVFISLLSSPRGFLQFSTLLDFSTAFASLLYSHPCSLHYPTLLTSPLSRQLLLTKVFTLRSSS